MKFKLTFQSWCPAVILGTQLEAGDQQLEAGLPYIRVRLKTKKKTKIFHSEIKGARNL